MSKIAVIDDEGEIREYLKMFFEEKGHSVVTAAQGEEGLEAIQKEGADLLILDIHLPNMDGIEVSKRLKETHPSLPIVFITGYAPETYKDETANLGDCVILRKPIDMDRLDQAVSELLSKAKS